MLQGSFETFDFAEVLEMLSVKRQTGKLRLHSGSSVVDLYLVDGRLVAGEALDHGPGAGRGASLARLEEACFEVLRWDHGSFEFHPGVTSPIDTGLDLAVGEALNGAERRLREWHRVEQNIPSFDAAPRLSTELGPETVTIDRAMWRALAAVDGRRNVTALARMLGISPFETSKVLSGLVSEGLIEFGPGRPRLPSVHREGDAPVVRLPQRTSSGLSNPAAADRVAATMAQASEGGESDQTSSGDEPAAKRPSRFRASSPGS